MVINTCMIKITDEEIIEAVENHDTMLQAAASLNVAFTTFIRYAKKLNVYTPNQNQIGVRKGGIVPVPLEEILNDEHPAYNARDLKRRLLKEKILVEICTECGIGDTWNGKPITLQLDHVDGDSHNHKKENLRILCPNCHTQTITWGRKNPNTKSVSDEEIIAAFNKIGTVRGTLAELRISKANDNYYRVRDLVVNL